MPRETYVIRDGKLVPKHLAAPHPNARRVHHGVMADIQDFETMDGVHIKSRSGLREYQRRTGLEQVGNDLICGQTDDGEMRGRTVEELPDVKETIYEAFRRHS